MNIIIKYNNFDDEINHLLEIIKYMRKPTKLEKMKTIKMIQAMMEKKNIMMYYLMKY